MSRFGHSRVFRGSRKSFAGGVILGVIAWVLLAIQVANMLNSSPDLLSTVVAFAIPTTLSITLFIGGLGIYLYDLDDLALRISAWTLLGLGLFTAILGGELVLLTTNPTSAPSTPVLFVNIAAAGAVLGFIVGLYDAHQRLLHCTLREEYDRTIGLSQRLSVLARILRHDLRNHLNVIIGHTDQLRQDTQSPADAEALAAIQQASTELHAISESIGRFSSVLADPQPTEATTSIDLTDAITTAIDRVQDRHDTADATFTVTAPPLATVEASPFLPQVITELVENAIIHNHTETPEIDITISTHPGTDSCDVFTIADNGPGIPEREIRVHETTRETQLNHSHGVGLWLVDWVVTASNASLRFDTSPADGTTIRIEFPA